MASGYDYKFVDDDKSKEFICPVCKLVARDAHQADCCGQIYCKSCIQQLKNSSSNFTCPTCRSDLTNNHFFDRRANRKIKSLQVYCNRNEADNGCQWKGDLKDIEVHLCPYQLVSCSNDCGMSHLQRRHLQDHLKNSCPKRLISCQYCFKKGHHQIITGDDHLGVCRGYPTSCTNEGCGKKVPRRQMPSHKKSCPKQMISCGYKSVGCKEKMKREEQEEHNEQWREQHLQLAAGEVKKLKVTNKELQIKFKVKTESLQAELKFSNEKLKIIKSTINTMPVIIDRGFFAKKLFNPQRYSPGFYTSPGGYKMCLCVYANGNGDGEGTHVSCYICLMSGKYDDILEWPFHGEVTIELLNQMEDKNHHKVVVSFDDSTPQECRSRVPRGAEYAASWEGKHKFISHSQLDINPSLNCQYLKDDDLYFRVSAKVTSRNTKPWLVAY